MKRILLPKEKITTISIDRVRPDSAIFAKRKNRLVGMVYQRNDGWVILLNKEAHWAPPVTTLDGCLTNGTRDGFTFFIDD